MKTIEIIIGEKPEQFENWTEEKTGEYVSTKERKMLHISYCGEIENFICGEICLYAPNYYSSIIDECSEDIEMPKYEETMGGFKIDHLYEITVPEGTYIEKYGDSERRCILTKNFSAKFVGIRKSWAIFVQGKGAVHYQKLIK